MFGPLRVEAIDVVRSEVGWDHDLVRASRLVSYDVVLAQERGACPSASTPPRSTDAVAGCQGLPALPETCTRETVRARIEITVRRAIDVQQRCAGDVASYDVADDADPRTTLAALGAACFRNKNKFRPETTWASLYALTELRIGERIDSVTSSTTMPRLIVALLGAPATPAFCRDDGAYLDGTPGVGRASTTADAPDVSLIAPQLAQRAPLAGEASPIGVTGATWRSEQSLWEECNAPAVRDALVAQQRCQLLRQLDRFVRDVEDSARPETPKGTPLPPAPSGSAKGTP